MKTIKKASIKLSSLALMSLVFISHVSISVSSATSDSFLDDYVQTAKSSDKKKGTYDKTKPDNKFKVIVDYFKDQTLELDSKGLITFKKDGTIAGRNFKAKDEFTKPLDVKGYNFLVEKKILVTAGSGSGSGRKWWNDRLAWSSLSFVIAVLVTTGAIYTLEPFAEKNGSQEVDNIA